MNIKDARKETIFLETCRGCGWCVVCEWADSVSYQKPQVWWNKKGESFWTLIQREVRGDGTLAHRGNVPRIASYTGFDDL